MFPSYFAVQKFENIETKTVSNLSSLRLPDVHGRSDTSNLTVVNLRDPSLDASRENFTGHLC